MKKYIRKADIILFIALIAIGLAASVALSLSRSEVGAGAKVVIESGGELYAQYPLSEARSVVVPAPKQQRAASDGSEAVKEASSQYDLYNVVTISGREVSVTEATCKNQVCVKHGSISYAGESIVCLPNRLVVRIEDPKGGGYDSITS